MMFNDHQRARVAMLDAAMSGLEAKEKTAILLAYCEQQGFGAMIDDSGGIEWGKSPRTGTGGFKAEVSTERPVGDAGSAATRIRLALEGLQEPDRMNALVTACRAVGVGGVLEATNGGRWLIGGWAEFERPSARRDGGHVSGILARVVDLLAQCSGADERWQVLTAAAAYHGAIVEPGAIRTRPD